MYNKKQILSTVSQLGLNLSLDGFENYLKDESKFLGTALGLIRAKTEADVVNSLKLANQLNIPLTVVSGKTSITGASAPSGGLILSVKDLDKVDERDIRNVGVGIILKDYKRMVENKGLFYPPDPTSEDSCTIGGTVACNASGSLSYLYGPTRDYIDRLKVVTPDTTVLDIERGKVFSEDGWFRLKPGQLRGSLVQDMTIPVPRIPQHPWRRVKNAAGLFSQDRMDLIDLFIGGEGILGIIVEVGTKLISKRKPYFALLIFVANRADTVSLVTTLDKIRNLFHKNPTEVQVESRDPVNICDDLSSELLVFSEICPSCMEWFSSSTSKLLDGSHAEKLSRFYGALYVEQEYVDSEDMYLKLQKWSEFVDHVKHRHNFGAIAIEAAIDEKHLRSMRLERVRVPERLNELIKPGLRKIGTDLSAPMDRLDDLMKMYDEKLPRDSSFVFGHIGNAHLHSNILARNELEIEKFNELHLQMAEYVCSFGGSVSGEHGIGKLKKKILKAMIGESGLKEIERVKSTLDPNWILNPGNIIDPVFTKRHLPVIDQNYS